MSRFWSPILAMAAAVTALAVIAPMSPATATTGTKHTRVVATVTGSATDWPTYNRTAARGGVSVSSPPVGVVRRSWTAAVDGQVFAQPLIIGSEVIIATENDTVYALKKLSGKVLWRRHLATPVSSGLPCGNINPSGITATPVADVATGRLWVVTFTRNPTFRHTLWELALKTGRPVASRPIDAHKSDPRAQQGRGALALLGSRVYVPYGGALGDCSDYFGRVVAAPISGKGKLLSYSTPDSQAGIWAPAGESVLGGSLYVATGNGSPATVIGDSDSVLRLSQQLQVQSRFTPRNFVSLSANDLDLGSTAPVVLPDGEIFQVGKEGVGYVLDGTRLGGTGGQLASAKVSSGAIGGCAVDGGIVVFSGYSSLTSVRVIPGNGRTKPKIRVRWSVPGVSGPPIIAGGVVWEMSPGDGALSGYRLSDGKLVFSASAAPAMTDFPGLAASGSRLIVPEGHEVVSYVGI